MSHAREPMPWLALAVRAQGYRRQACQQEVALARDQQAQAERHAERAQAESSSVLQAWQHHRTGGDAGAVLEDSYRQFHAHAHAAGLRAQRACEDAAHATGEALDALRDSFNRHHALQTLEQRGQADAHRHHQRAETRTVSEAWALRRADGSKDL